MDWILNREHSRNRTNIIRFADVCQDHYWQYVLMWEQKESNLPSMRIMWFTVTRLTNSSITLNYAESIGIEPCVLSPLRFSRPLVPMYATFQFCRKQENRTLTAFTRTRLAVGRNKPIFAYFLFVWMIGSAPIPVVFQTTASTKLASLTNCTHRKNRTYPVGFGDQLAYLGTFARIKQKIRSVKPSGHIILWKIK